MQGKEPGTVELTVSDYSQLGSLANYLRLTAPQASVTRTPGLPEHGEQGALDVLMMVADSSVLVAALKALPEFIRSRKSKPSITVKVKDKKGRSLTVTATNADEVALILDRFLDA
jgi:hypothetical protein